MSIDEVKLYNDLSYRTLVVARGLNTEECWSDYFKACTIEDMQKFMTKYERED